MTIVNALLDGSGCASAIGLGCEATVRLTPASPGEVPEPTFSPGADTPLARAVIRGALFAYAPLERHRVEVGLRSEIPRAFGLKSSSAVSVALLQALAQARGYDPAPMELARRAADIAQASGQSATGAFDDALAAAGGGTVVTDNRTRSLRHEGNLELALSVLLWMPNEPHAPSPALSARFAGSEAAGHGAIGRALAGDYVGAMERNTVEVERALGYTYGALRGRLRAAGAAGAGVTGMGPTLAVLVAPAQRQAVQELLDAETGRLREVPLRALGAPAPPMRTGAG
ncbi:MAG: shikimate kinase [Thermoplasmata archaeon]